MVKETKNGRKKKKVKTPSLTSLQPLPKSNLQRFEIPGIIKVTGIDKIGTTSPIKGFMALVVVASLTSPDTISYLFILSLNNH